MYDLQGRTWVYTSGMELFHVINRGIDERKLFLDSQDYARFVHNLFEFNDTAPAPGSDRRNIAVTNVGPRRSYIRERLIELHGWVLMENHYHLLISELVENGLIKFMTKINVGYAKYYNDRYERHGHLFQGKTKKILLRNSAHFLYILHYVHLNPLDYLSGAKKWRQRDKGTIPDIQKSLEHLKNYRWSSYLDYCGMKNFPSILTTSLFKDAFGARYATAVKEYLTERGFEEDADEKYLEY